MISIDELKEINYDFYQVINNNNNKDIYRPFSNGISFFYNNSIYIIGGTYNKIVLSKSMAVYKLDYKNNYVSDWKKLNFINSNYVPDNCINHRGIKIKNIAYIYGGKIDNKSCNILFGFNFDSEQFIFIPCIGAPNKENFSMFNFNDEFLFIHGGICVDNNIHTQSNYNNDLYYYNISKRKWDVVTQNEIVYDKEIIPDPRENHKIIKNNNEFYLFGGSNLINYREKEGELMNDLYKIKVEQINNKLNIFFQKINYNGVEIKLSEFSANSYKEYILFLGGKVENNETQYKEINDSLFIYDTINNFMYEIYITEKSNIEFQGYFNHTSLFIENNSDTLVLMGGIDENLNYNVYIHEWEFKNFNIRNYEVDKESIELDDENEKKNMDNQIIDNKWTEFLNKVSNCNICKMLKDLNNDDFKIYNKKKKKIFFFNRYLLKQDNHNFINFWDFCLTYSKEIPNVLVSFGNIWNIFHECLKLDITLKFNFLEFNIFLNDSKRLIKQLLEDNSMENESFRFFTSLFYFGKTILIFYKEYNLKKNILIKNENGTIKVFYNLQNKKNNFENTKNFKFDEFENNFFSDLSIKILDFNFDESLFIKNSFKVKTNDLNYPDALDTYLTIYYNGISSTIFLNCQLVETLLFKQDILYDNDLQDYNFIRNYAKFENSNENIKIISVYNKNNFIKYILLDKLENNYLIILNDITLDLFNSKITLYLENRILDFVKIIDLKIN